MGYSWIYLFNPNYEFTGMDFSLMFNPSLVASSYIMSLMLIIVVYLGIQIGDRNNLKINNKASRLSPKSTISNLFNYIKWTDKSYRNLGLAVLFVSLPIRVYVDNAKISLSQTQDYLATFDLQINGYIAMLADMYIVGIVLLMIYYKNKRWISTLLLSVTSIYLLFSMTSGSRGAAMISIIILFYVYNLCVYKFKKSVFVLIIFVAIFIGTYLTSIGLSRIDTSYNAVGPQETVSRFFQEFGGTQLTMILTMNKIENKEIQESLGKTYFSSLATILPNTSDSLESYVKDNNFVLRLEYPSIGGSYFAEMYYNFAMLSCLIAFVIGYAISRFEIYIINLNNASRYATLALTILLARQSLWWIRDTFQVFPRYILEGIIIMIIIVYILKRFGQIKPMRNSDIMKGHLV